MITLKNFLRAYNQVNKKRRALQIIWFMFFFFHSSCFINSTYAQNQRTWKWVNQIGGPSWDVSTNVIADEKDNLYLAGRFSENISCNGRKATSIGENDIFLAKFDSKGNIKDLWNYGGKGDDKATCIANYLENSIVLGGTYSDSAVFGKFKIAKQGMQIFVSKIDNKGKVCWLTSIHSIGKASLSLVKSDAAGNIIAAGSFSGILVSDNKKISSNGLNDIFIIKINPIGTIEKIISFGSEDDEIITSLSLDSQGEITFSGKFLRAFMLDQILLSPSKQNSNLFLAHLNSDLKTQSVQHLFAPDFANILRIEHDRFNNLYVAGSFNMELHISDTVLHSFGYTDGFIAKFNPSGEMNYTRKIGSQYYDYITGINIDNLDGVILTGSIGDTLQIDSLIIRPKQRGDAAIILQLNEDGKALWGDYITGSGRNFSNGAVLDKNGNLYFCGSFQNSFSRDDDELISRGDQDIFLARYYNCPDQNLLFNGDQVLCPGNIGEISVGNRYKSISWNDTILNKNFLEIYYPGKYWASIITKNGCRYTDTIYVSKAPIPDFSLGTDTTVLVIDTITLKPKGKFLSYLWTDGSNDQTKTAFTQNYTPQTNIYSVMVTDSLGCTWSDSISVTFQDIPDIDDFLNLKLITYPNPAINEIHWYLITEKTCRFTIDITDGYGHCLYTEYIPVYSSGQIKTISMDKFPVGSYIIRIKNPITGKIFSSRSVIKQ